ncbi:MAG: cobalamin-binding protein, partial [Achromobacter sp.]|nr:cobalamin-binding protein [Achromobacter sp.]
MTFVRALPFAVLGLLCAPGPAAAAPSAKTAAATSAEAPAAIHARDDRGRDVTLAVPARRAVTL